MPDEVDGVMYQRFWGYQVGVDFAETCSCGFGVFLFLLCTLEYSLLSDLLFFNSFLRKRTGFSKSHHINFIFVQV